MTSKWDAFEEVGRLLQAQRWIFAKTMPQNPHEYTLRRNWQHDAEFVQVVQYIRKHGYSALFRGRPYTQLNVNDHFYWTMGSPIPETILINRKVRASEAGYDPIAPVYDGLFMDPAHLTENEQVCAMLGDLSGKSVLDVGCGTGLLLDYATPRSYCGIDSSRAMIAQLSQKHPEQQESVICTDLRSFVGPAGRYDLVVALFGTASYLDPEELARVPTLLNQGGCFSLMFYKPGYVPETHSRTQVFLPFQLYANIPRGSVRYFNNYTVVEGAR